MGKLLFLGVTAFLAVRYITRSGEKNKPQVKAAGPKSIEVEKPAGQLPPSEA